MCHGFALSWERPNCESMSGANAPFEVAQLAQHDLADSGQACIRGYGT